MGVRVVSGADGTCIYAERSGTGSRLGGAAEGGVGRGRIERGGPCGVHGRRLRGLPWRRVHRCWRLDCLTVGGVVSAVVFGDVLVAG